MKSNIELGGAKGIRHLLGTNDTLQNPESVQLDTVQPVIEMSMGGYSKIHNQQSNFKRVFQIISNAAASKTINCNLIDYGQSVGGSQILDIDYKARVYSVEGDMKFDDITWAGTYAGRQVYYELVLTYPFQGTSTYHVITNGVLSIGQNNWYVPFSNLGVGSLSNCTRNLVVPAGGALSFGVVCNGRNGGASDFNFGAINTVSINVYCTFLQVPVGAPLPML